MSGPDSCAPNLYPVDFHCLQARHLDAWHTLRASNPSLDSPYFHVGFTAAVHDICGDVQVVVGAGERGAVTSLMPIQRQGRLARPAGWPAVDFQGPIISPVTRCQPEDLIQVVGVRAFVFDHLLDGLPGFESWVEAQRPSPYLDVTGGLDGYLGRASTSGKDNMGQARRQVHMADRDLGTVRFVADSRDPALLNRVVSLKRAQYAATGVRDALATPSQRELLLRLLRTRDGSFGGMLSAVYAGPHLVAAHFGLRDGGVLHWWLPVYEPLHGHLSPDWILLRELVTAAPALGLQRIDLGMVEDEYKRRAMTGHTLVCEGMVLAGSLQRRLRRTQRAVVNGIRSSPLAPRIPGVIRAGRKRR
ncbi:MAG: GNAT family N-acetyltransferase [Actinomycetota bacterium]|nr:GNAT family N-acetyltransferase [Actinomycetota bacterium]